MIRPEDLRDAIEIIEYSRSTHAAWRDYYDSHDGMCPHGAECPELALQRNVAGDRAYQVTRIERYDRVLAVLCQMAQP